MSLLQRRHYNHLAEMTNDIKRICERHNILRGPRNSIKHTIIQYMRIGNPNFDEYRFLKAAGWLDEEE